ncbi:MAG: pyridoxamine 5'-phosphate oxidase family protein [Actinomycetota bacterium]|nr:pyridoxamine 5'-phosphate oxidase family protein [Actinomycetota bacterium]
MSSWQEFCTAAPELAASVEARFTATKHHVLATLRRDGSPRVSGTEVELADAHLRIGSMWAAVKATDLQRDGRFALHANPGDGSMTGGDAKLSGVAVEVLDHPDAGKSHLFDLDIRQVVLTSVHSDGDRLVISVWRPDHAVQHVERR